MTDTQIRLDYSFELSCHINSKDFENVRQAIAKGIDSRLTGFTKSRFTYKDERLYCWIHSSEIEILIRRLLELETESAEQLADAIVLIQYKKETI